MKRRSWLAQAHVLDRPSAAPAGQRTSLHVASPIASSERPQTSNSPRLLDVEWPFSQKGIEGPSSGSFRGNRAVLACRALRMVSDKEPVAPHGEAVDSSLADSFRRSSEADATDEESSDSWSRPSSSIGDGPCRAPPTTPLGLSLPIGGYTPRRDLEDDSDVSSPPQTPVSQQRKPKQMSLNSATIMFSNPSVPAMIVADLNLRSPQRAQHVAPRSARPPTSHASGRPMLSARGGAREHSETESPRWASSGA